jgi:hypothetical protein
LWFRLRAALFMHSVPGDSTSDRSRNSMAWLRRVTRRSYDTLTLCVTASNCHVTPVLRSDWWDCAQVEAHDVALAADDQDVSNLGRKLSWYPPPGSPPYSPPESPPYYPPESPPYVPLHCGGAAND